MLSRWRTDPERVVLGPDKDRPPAGPDRPEVAVTGGGNVGMIWFPRLDERPRLDEIVRRRPDLVAGLLAGPVAVHDQLLAWRRGIGAGPAS